MMTGAHILVPVDFSEHSARALDCAKTLAQKDDVKRASTRWHAT